MARRKKHIVPPSFEDERELEGFIDNNPESCQIRGRRYKFKMLSGFAQHKITQILTSKKDDAQDTCKCVAAAWLNGFFSLKFFYWLVWRWFYFIRQYSEEDLENAVALIKKKIPQKEYYTNTILLIGMRETMMTMNKNEVYLMLREHSGDRDGKFVKSENGSPNLSDS